MCELNYNWECPSCGGNKIEEIMTDCIVSSPIYNIYEMGDTEYGNQSTDYGIIDRYQCIICGHVIEGVKNTEELYNYLKEMECLREKE